MASQLPMADWITEVKPDDVIFFQKLQESANSAVFKVAVHGRICVMKVYHDRGPSDYDPSDLEVNLFVCESTAYRRMKANGLCEQGVVPDFYGTITKIQPTLWPSLHMFCGDNLPPNAILIEYIPNMKSINLSNFSKDYLDKFRQVLDDIHQAGVLHGDAKPRNMMISQGKQDRVLWIDFDSAQTFSEGCLSQRQERWVQEENELVDYFIEALAQDFKEGRINRTASYYYEYFVE
ncbi:hypothetical protein SI65_04155 [Aspergillus cristatus]|uniref:Protein kinase domain-containing protein n=1 Tax=Aspergillus cristatus TaxID=573508 RepID=A0A1E3BJE8_ASPCR|nr:hypothetical protein SI65_04155 [Aspergillus cristatus]